MKLKKALAFVLVLAVLSTGLTALGVDAATRDDFKTIYAQYSNLYHSTYVPAYNGYYTAMDALSAKLEDGSVTDPAKRADLKAFIAATKEARSAFFGDRVTAGTSRYDVPEMRNLMNQANADKNYTLAVDYCNQLIVLINARVDFLTTTIESINDYLASLETEDPEEPEEPEEPGDISADVEFNVTNKVSDTFYEFEIKITNTSEDPVSNWNLAFTYDGIINTLWAADGSSLIYSNVGGDVSVAPGDVYQVNYTIPAGATITLLGNGTTIGTAITDATFTGEDITVAFNAPEEPEDPEEPEEPEVPEGAVSASFSTTGDQWWYEFDLVLTNTSDVAISNWTLTFTYDGVVDTMWGGDGSSIIYSNVGGNISVAPGDVYQVNYTIPAGGSITLKGNGNTKGTAVTNATFNGEAITVAMV